MSSVPFEAMIATFRFAGSRFMACATRSFTSASRRSATSDATRCSISCSMSSGRFDRSGFAWVVIGISPVRYEPHLLCLLQYMTTLTSCSRLNLGCDNIGRSPYFAVSPYISKEVVLHGKEGSRCPSGDINLVVDMLDVMIYGLLGDSEKPAYLLLGVSARDQSQDLHFALAEPGHQFSTGRANTVTCSGKHAVDRFTVESPCTDLASQLLGSSFRCSRWTVGPWLDHRMVDIGCGKNSSCWRQHACWYSAMVARTIKPLVLYSRQ